VTSADSLEAFLNRARARIDEALELYLPRPPACPRVVSEAMRYSVFAGGKRLRPTLTLASAEAVGRIGNRRREKGGPATDSEAIGAALPAACAIELLHTYSLIHDDLPAMDNDTLRRGRPTLHVVYGDGMAILAGDGLQAEAFALLAREPIATDADTVARKLHVLQVITAAAGTTGLVGGQAIDLQAAGRAPGLDAALDAEGVRTMHAQKTGALIRASAVSGAIMAGGDAATIQSIDGYATELGLAFQIVDDILDVEGSTGELGKTVGKDALAAKPTYPALFGLTRSRELATECVARARQSLVDARISDGWLAAIAEWSVARRH
jgi:geranylgeranyl diphosphate synthase, type II